MAGTDQTFNVSYAKDAEFKGDGPRAFFEYRDLGMGAATGGRYHAQVIRARESCAGTGAHTHDLDFQMVYVLKGWVRFDYEGQGEVRLGPGDSVLQPPGHRPQPAGMLRGLRADRDHLAGRVRDPSGVSGAAARAALTR